MKTKSVIFGVAVLLAAAVSLSAYSIAAADAPASNVPTAPCTHEDSAGPCYWDAQTMGNGKGRSFYVDAEQVVHYKG